MAIHVALNHCTRYRYDRLVNLGPQVVRLRPAPHCRTRILSYSLRVTPSKHFINWQQDPQSNFLARLVFAEQTREFVVEVDLVAEMAVYNPFDFFLEPSAERFPFTYDAALDHELEPFRRRGELTPRFKNYLESAQQELLGKTIKLPPRRDDQQPRGTSRAQGHDGQPQPQAGVLTASRSSSEEQRNIEKPAERGAPAPQADSPPRTIDFLVALNRKLWKDIRYIIRLEPGVQAPEETLEKGKGSCRDSAWLLCQLLRCMGLSSRFVSGYLIQLAPDVKSLDGPSGTERDFTDLHAWCEVYLPGAGWIGLDPTSGLLAGEGHIPLAATPDPQSAAPVTGEVDECKCEFSFDMKVARIYESPRVTKPYTEEQWAEIEALGNSVDEALRRSDCRLTMGGEPTFVSIDDMDGAEWNTIAVGPNKRRLADGLMKRLKGRFATGGLLHYGQGKWYPGESLPRWAFGCYWRKDGQPIWVEEDLFADESKNYGFEERRAEEFIQLLADQLGCGGKWVMPAFEDTWYYLWKERRLPTNVDPFNSKLKNEEERVRLAKIFEQGLDKVIGYTLPLERRFGTQGPFWYSGPWFFRPERCYLIPGDSPIGFRLPLDSLPYITAQDYPYLNEQEPFEERPPLPPHEQLRQMFVPGSAQPAFADRQRNPRERAEHERAGRGDGRPRPAPEQPAEAETELADGNIRQPVRGESADWIVRTSLCVEPRHGRLHVFMPPVRTLEDYLSVTTAVEETARALDTPVIIEGYTPPFDPRLNVLKITPDPGVIEVNIHPAHSWREMVNHTEILYEEARQSRLGTEKFMVDGRHTGTGGGNHIVIGGATPAQSPLLRRPDLLRSLTAYWQNHPSLSFLFSSLFLGPTSQSPRIDEARNDSLYELEVAFRQVPNPFGAESYSADSYSASTAQTCAPPWLIDRLFRNLLIDATGNTHRAEFCIDKLFSPESSSGRLGLLEMRAFEMPPHARMSLAQQLLLRTLIAKFWTRPYTNNLVRWGTDIHDRWMLPHFVWSDFCDVVEDVHASGFAMKPEWFAPHFEFRFPQLGDVETKNIFLEIRHALEPWHVLGEEAGPGGTVRFVDSSVERVQLKARGLIDSRHVIAVNGVAAPLHPTGTNGEYVAGVRYRAWQPSSCLHPTIGVHSPLTFDIIDTWNGRSIGGCVCHVAHPGGRNYVTFPINAYEAESRRLSRFSRTGHTPGRSKPRHVEPSREFPFTLDLRAV